MLTPQTSYPALAGALGLTTLLYLKREDLHPLGSHKGRSIPEMMTRHAAHGVRNFVISSSGNAARAAAQALPDNATLTIFVGEKIDPEKLKLLSEACHAREAIRLEVVANPKQRAFQMEKTGAAKNLRQSTDDAALEGYRSLARELNEIPNLEAVFIPTSSGTTAQALGTGLPRVQIHVVQTEAVHPIAEQFDKNFTPQKTSWAGAIVDTIAHRKSAVTEVIKKSGGFGWVVSDEEIQRATNLVAENTGLNVSPNSALSIAGLAKALKSGRQWSGAVACLITGA